MKTRRNFLKLLGKLAVIMGVGAVAPSQLMAKRDEIVNIPSDSRPQITDSIFYDKQSIPQESDGVISLATISERDAMARSGAIAYGKKINEYLIDSIIK